MFVAGVFLDTDLANMEAIAAAVTEFALVVELVANLASIRSLALRCVCLVSHVEMWVNPESMRVIMKSSE